MPIESRQVTPPVATGGSIGEAYLREARDTLAASVRKIRHCLDQLADDALWWRPHESHNSIQNILLHLCGNVRQWIIHGVGGAPDDRNRPQEFSERRPIAKQALIARLEATVAEADAALGAFDPQRLLEPRRIQGFDTNVLAAIFDSVSHFVGHTHQIVYLTRLRVGDAYRFQFVPATKEQGAPQ
jgi:hypothetical protein